MQVYSQPDLAWLSLAGSEFGNKMSGYGANADLHHFLGKMNYSLTQTDMANPKTQYCDSTHLNPFADLKSI